MHSGLRAGKEEAGPSKLAVLGSRPPPLRTLLVLNPREQIIRLQGQVDKQYAGLKDMAEERRRKLENMYHLFQLKREVADLEQWVTEKDMVASSSEMGQDFDHVTVSVHGPRWLCLPPRQRTQELSLPLHTHSCQGRCAAAMRAPECEPRHPGEGVRAQLQAVAGATGRLCDDTAEPRALITDDCVSIYPCPGAPGQVPGLCPGDRGNWAGAGRPRECRH